MCVRVDVSVECVYIHFLYFKRKRDALLQRIPGTKCAAMPILQRRMADNRSVV